MTKSMENKIYKKHLIIQGKFGEIQGCVIVTRAVNFMDSSVKTYIGVELFEEESAQPADQQLLWSLEKLEKSCINEMTKRINTQVQKSFDELLGEMGYQNIKYLETDH